MTFDELFPLLPVRGWLAEDEARLLWQYARDWPEASGAGLILEIGSYCGKSSRLLAEALRPGGRLFCCDPFLEGFDGEQTPTSNEIVIQWCESVCRSPAALGVTLLWMTERQLFETNWRACIDLLFIDGDHSYGGTKGALDRWAPAARVVAMHDYAQCASFEGVKRACDDYGLGSPHARAGSLAVWRTQHQ